MYEIILQWRHNIYKNKSISILNSDTFDTKNVLTEFAFIFIRMHLLELKNRLNISLPISRCQSLIFKCRIY